jgi:hypothetical protein
VRESDVHSKSLGGWYLVNRGHSRIDHLPLKRLKHNSLILDSKLRRPYTGDNLPRANIYFLVVEHTDDVAVLAGAGAFDVGEQLVFEVGAHVGAEEGGVQGEGQDQVFLLGSLVCATEKGDEGGGTYEEEHD